MADELTNPTARLEELCRDEPGLAERIDAAISIRQLGHALVGHEADPTLSRRIAAVARALSAELEKLPARSRAEMFTASPRFLAALESGVLEIGLGDGDELDYFVDSVVSGSANPMGLALRIRREGDEVVARTTVGPAFEGAPGRVHGGIVAAMIDETMGAILPMLGTLAYTAQLRLDYLKPTPVNTPIEVRSRLRQRKGRRLTLEAEVFDRDEMTVRAEALFLTVDIAAFIPAELGGPNPRQ